MKRIVSLALGALLFAAPAFARIPWGTTGSPLQVSGATPTCTYTATALACIENMTNNVTSITLAGMTAGQFYTLILMQDGTGSRTLAQTAVTGAPALTTAESAANGYAVWVIKATSASAATFVSDYTNLPLGDVFITAQTSNGTAIAAGVTQAQPTIVAPGMTATSPCSCAPQTLPATWQTGVLTQCLPQTNALQCELTNVGPANATVTPTANAVNVRLSPIN